MSESRAYKLYFDPLKAEFSLLGIPAIEVESQIKHYLVKQGTMSVIAHGDVARVFSSIEIDGTLEVNGEYFEIKSSEITLFNETIPSGCNFAVPSRHQINLLTNDVIINGFLEIDGEVIEL